MFPLQSSREAGDLTPGTEVVSELAKGKDVPPSLGAGRK